MAQLINVCCPQMLDALNRGTDSDGYDALFRIDIPEVTNEDLCINVGENLPPINYCPWCGEDVQTRIRLPIPGNGEKNE